MKTNEVLVFFKEQGVCEIFKFKSLLGLNISLIPMYESTSRIAGPNVLLTFSISAFNRGKLKRVPLCATRHTGDGSLAKKCLINFPVGVNGVNANVRCACVRT